MKLIELEMEPIFISNVLMSRKREGFMVKRILIMMTTLALVFGFVLPGVTQADSVIDEKLGVPIVVYGANLSDTEKESVRKSLEVDKEAEVEEIYVEGSDLVKYIPDGDSKARMYSSAKITRQDAGKGLVIKIVNSQKTYSTIILSEKTTPSIAPININK